MENQILEDVSKVLSTRTNNICRSQGWVKLVDIYDYYMNHKTFMNIKNCGRRCHEELIEFIEKFKQESEIAIPELHSSLDNTFAIFKISEYTKMQCINSKIITLKELLDFYIKHGSFLFLDSMDSMSNKELKKVCKRLLKHGFYPGKLSESRIDIDEYSLLLSLRTSEKDKLFDLKLRSLLEHYSNKSYNVLLQNVRSDFTLQSIYYNFLADHIDLTKIYGVGPATLPDLIQLRMEIWEVLNAIYFSDSEQNNYSLEALETWLAMKGIGINSDFLSSLFDNQELRFFNLMEVLINHEKFVDTRVSFILKNRGSGMKGQKEMTLDELGVSLHLTRERVRQILLALDMKIRNAINEFGIYLSIPDLFVHRYGIDYKSDVINISNSLFDKINALDNTKLGEKFILQIIESILFPTHRLFRENQFKLNHGSEQKSSDHIFISTELCIDFDFHKLFYLIQTTLKQTNRSEMLIDINDFFYPESKEISESIKERIFNALFMILANVWGIQVDNDMILLNRPGTKKDFIITVLEAAGVPLHIEEIMDKVNALYPKKFKSVGSVREHCYELMGNELVFYGRSSTYGLKKWDSENRNIKSGTIRDLAEEYLSLHPGSQTISELVTFIQIWRPNSSKNSIVSNLKLEQNERFYFPENGKICLGKPI